MYHVLINGYDADKRFGTTKDYVLKQFDIKRRFFKDNYLILHR